MTNVCNQYYKCPTTGVEMIFRFSRGSGWGVSFPFGIKQMRKLKEAGIRVPFPETPDEYKQEVEDFYKRLEEWK